MLRIIDEPEAPALDYELLDGTPAAPAAGVLGIVETMPAGYTNYGLGALHPDGSVYAAVQYNNGPRQILIRKRSATGQWSTLKTYQAGREFPTVAGIAQAIPLPGGSLLVLIPIERNGQVRQAEEELPGLCPPFSPGMIYQYAVSAEDRIARQQAAAANQVATRAEQAAAQAKRDVASNGAKVEARINEVVELAKKTITGMKPSAEQVLTVVNAQLNDASALAAFVWQKARDASYAHLKEHGIIK